MEKSILKLLKIEKEDDMRFVNFSLKNLSFIEIVSDESVVILNICSVFIFGILKIIGLGGVKLKGNFFFK